MSNNAFWDILNETLAGKFDSWWVLNWYSWLVYVAFTIVFVLLLLIILRYILIAGRPVVESSKVVLGLIGSAVFLALLLILPSLLISFFLSASLLLVGINNVSNLQQLTVQEWQDITAVFRWFSWFGLFGFFSALASIAPRSCRRLLFKDIATQTQKQFDISSSFPPPPPGPITPIPIDFKTNTPYTPTPPYPDNPAQIKVPVEELTPIPKLQSKDTAITSPNEELTPLPPEPLPVAAWLQAISYASDKGRIFELETVVTKIGREQGDIILDKDESISGVHAVIEYDRGDFFFKDYSRHQSSWVNDRQVRENEVIHIQDGNRLRLGKSIFYFNVIVWPQIKILSGPMANKKIIGRRTPITIGVGDANHIRISKDNGLLDMHAQIELDRQTKQFILEPKSEHGILIDNQQPKDSPPWPLPDGCKVKIGKNSFSFHLVEEE